MDHVEAEGKSAKLEAANGGSVAGSEAATGLDESLWLCPIEEFRHPSNYRLGIQAPIKLSVEAICEDIGFRSRAALRDRVHRDDRRLCVIT
jgi:hypothetical protein